MLDPMDLSGKHIIITGASSGIGRATAIRVSQLGAKVSLIARREDKLIETRDRLEGKGHCTYSFDLTEIEKTEELVREIVQNSGPLDGVVYCAGKGFNRPLAMTKPSFFQEMMAINFLSFAEFLRLAMKKKISRDGASLVGISSVAAQKGDRAQGAYAASKAAMDGLLHSAAKEAAPRKIRVNTVAFGMIHTEMYQIFQESGNIEELLHNQYLGLGDPADAANIIAFLLSGASRLITGTTLVADNGYLS